MTSDLEAFQGILTLMQQQYKESNIIKDRQQLEVAMIPFASLREAVSHYLEVMTQIEDGTYVNPDDGDGGQN